MPQIQEFPITNIEIEEFPIQGIKIQEFPAKPKPKNILLETLKLTGKDILSSFKDVPAQVQDISSIPSKLAGFKTIPLQSKLATETLPYMLEKATTPVRLPSFSMQNIKSIAKGRGITDISEDLTPLDLAFIGFMAKGAISNTANRLRWNAYINKGIQTEKIKGAVLNNIEPLEKALATVGIKLPSNMSLEDKMNVILSKAKESPKLGSIIGGLAEGRIKPLGGRVDVTSAAKVSPVVKAPTVETPIVSPPITPEPTTIMPVSPTTPIVPPSVAVQPLSPTGEGQKPQPTEGKVEIRKVEIQKIADTIQSKFKQYLPEGTPDEVIAKNTNAMLLGLGGDNKALASYLHKDNKAFNKIFTELTGHKIGKDVTRQQLADSQGSLLENLITPKLSPAGQKLVAVQPSIAPKIEPQVPIISASEYKPTTIREYLIKALNKWSVEKDDKYWDKLGGIGRDRIKSAKTEINALAKKDDTLSLKDKIRLSKATTFDEIKAILEEDGKVIGGKIANVGDDVEFLTEGGISKTGTVSNILGGKYYVIPDGASNSIPVKGISRVIPTKRAGEKPTPKIPTVEQFIINNLRGGLSKEQLTEAYYLQYPVLQPEAKSLSPERQGELFEQSVQQAPTVNIGEPPTETGITSEAGQAVIPEVNIPSSSIVRQSGNLVKYFLGTKEERWKVVLGEETGRKVFETLRYFDRAVNLASALTEARNKALFKGIGIKTRRFIFDVLKGTKRIDENGIIEFGALQPSGIVPGEFTPGQLLPDGRIVGEATDEVGSQFMTYRKYNTEEAYYKLIAKYPRAKAVIDQYLANEEALKKTILGTDIPAFSRNILKQQFNIKTNQPEDFSYVPSMLREQRILGKIKNIFKSYTAGGRKKKTGALAEAGLEEKDILKALTVRQQELIYEDLFNNAAGDILAMVLEPIEGRRLKPGYVQVNINSPRIQKITQLKKELLQANGIDPDKLSLFQYPSAVDKEFNLSETQRFANPELQRVYDNAKKISDTFISGVTTNYLIRPSTANRNFISGLIQYNLKTLTHLYEGNLPAMLEDIKALGTALKPSVRKMLPSEILGGTFVSDVAGKSSVFSSFLAPFRAIEYYFKRASFEADLSTIARKKLFEEIKKGRVKPQQGNKFIEDFKQNYFADLFQMLSDNADSVTYDYWNKPYILEKLSKGLGKGIIPFPNYIYHKARMYIEYSPLGLSGINKENAKNKIAKVLAGLTMWLTAWAIAEKAVKEREKQMNELALKRIDVAFNTTGRIKFYADEKTERWLRVYDIPILGDILYWREISQGRADFGDWASDALSLGPIMKLPLILMGLKSKYEMGKTTPSLAGEQAAGWIPFSAYIRYIRVLKDPDVRQIYSNDYSAFENFINPFKDVVPGISETIPERVVKKGIDKGEIKRYDIPSETMKLLFLNVKSIDKQEYMQYVNDQIYSGKVQKRIEKQTRKK